MYDLRNKLIQSNQQELSGEEFDKLVGTPIQTQPVAPIQTQPVAPIQTQPTVPMSEQSTQRIQTPARSPEIRQKEYTGNEFEEILRNLPATVVQDNPSLVDYVVSAGKTGIGIVDSALGMILSGWIGDPIAGTLGIVKTATSGPEAATKETIRPIQDVASSIFPMTKAGKQVSEKVAAGAEMTVGKLSNFYEKMITEKAAELGYDIGGPNAAALAGAIAATIPTAAGAMADIKGIKKRGVKPLPSLRNKFPKYKRWLPSSLKINEKPRYTKGYIKETFARLSPTVSKKGAFKKASHFMVKQIRFTPIDIKNIKEAVRLQEKIKGLKLHVAGTAMSPGAKQLVSGLKKVSTGVGQAADKLYRLEKNNYKAAKTYLKQITPKGSLEDLRNFVRSKKQLIDRDVEAYRSKMQKQIARIRGGEGTLVSVEDFIAGGRKKFTESGKKVKATQKAAELATRRRVSKLFDDIPDNIIDMNPTVELLKDILKPTSMAEPKGKNIPISIRSLLKNLKKEGNMTTAKELHAAVSDIRRDLRDMQRRGEKRNRSQERRMVRAIGALDSAMENVEFPDVPTAQAFKKAKDAYYNEVVNVYDNPTYWEVHGTVGGKPIVDDANIVGKYFREGRDGIAAAESFIQTVGKKAEGNKGAYEALEAWMDNDLVDFAYDFGTGQLSKTKLKDWLDKHKYALEKFGYSSRYEYLELIDEIIDNHMLLRDEFDKSVVSKMIDLDIDKEMDFILRSKTPGKDAMELMRQIKDDPRAIRGVQAAMMDQIDKVDVKNIKELDALYDHNEQAYKAIFAREPQKIKDMNDYREAIRRISPKGDLPDDWESLNQIFRSYFPQPWASKNVVDILRYVVVRGVPEIGKDEIRRLITKAALNPELAYLLRRYGKQKMPKRVFERKLSKILSYMLSTSNTVLMKKLSETKEEE